MALLCDFNGPPKKVVLHVVNKLMPIAYKQSQVVYKYY